MKRGKTSFTFWDLKDLGNVLNKLWQTGWAPSENLKQLALLYDKWKTTSPDYKGVPEGKQAAKNFTDWMNTIGKKFYVPTY